MKKIHPKIFIALILLLCLFTPSIAKAQVICDTLYLFPDTTTFMDEQNGLILDWMSNFAVKFNIPTEDESIIVKEVGVLIFNLDTSSTFDTYFRVSIGSVPEETILYKKNVTIDTSSITFPIWQFYTLDSIVQIRNDSSNNSFFISGLIFLRTATTHMYDSLLLNQFIYHAYDEYWIAGMREYLPIKVVVERKISEVNKDDPVVNSYHLYQNYPNPFNPSTKISYSMKESGFVSLKVYDILGNEIIRLVNTTQQAGNHSVEFNAVNLPSGVYIYTVKVNGYSASKKMILLK